MFRLEDLLDKKKKPVCFKGRLFCRGKDGGLWQI